MCTRTNLHPEGRGSACTLAPLCLDRPRAQPAVSSQLFGPASLACVVLASGSAIRSDRAVALRYCAAAQWSGRTRLLHPRLILPAQNLVVEESASGVDTESASGVDEENASGERTVVMLHGGCMVATPFESAVEMHGGRRAVNLLAGVRAAAIYGGGSVRANAACTYPPAASARSRAGGPSLPSASAASL
eukprot:scaffold131062_cov27-Tisochrysis_lutea.AAC.1